MTCALGRRVSSTFGGGPSGSELLQRSISETLTVFGLAPKGSIVLVPVAQLIVKSCGTTAGQYCEQEEADLEQRSKSYDRSISHVTIKWALIKTQPEL